MRGYSKRPSDTLVVELDFRPFAEQVAPETVVYTLRAEPGVLVLAEASVDGLIELTVTGGVRGRQYVLGVEAVSSGGQTLVQDGRIRVREKRQWDGLPVIGVITPGADSVPAGALLLNSGAIFFNVGHLVLAS
jgi:hypothetical protein